MSSKPARKPSTRGNTKPSGTDTDSIHDTECLRCGEVIYGECIECDACGNWSHKRESCCGMNEQEFALVGNRHIKWVCNVCLDGDTLEKSSVLNKKMDRLFLMIGSLENRLERMEKNGKNQEGQIEEMVNKIVDKKLKERLDNFEEKKAIEKNVIFCGINENSLNAREAKEDDLRRIREISSAICPSIEQSDITEPIRLGRVNIGQEAKPRPIKVTVKTVKQKWDLIKNARHLKDIKEIYSRDNIQDDEEEGSENTAARVIMENETIYINPDLTRAERMEQKGLRDELKRRKALGEVDIMIKGNQIVKKQPRETGAQRDRQDRVQGDGQGPTAGNRN